MKTREADKPEHFYTRFEEEWKIVRKCDRTKGHE